VAFQRTFHSQINLKKKHKAGGPPFMISKHSNATMLKTGLYSHKDKYAEQLNKINSSEIDFHRYVQMIVKKGASLHNGESIVYSTNSIKEMDSHMKRNEAVFLS
jgi:hypothetical protein